MDKKCDECIEHILKHKDSLAGVALQGITDGSEESLAVSIEILEAVLKKVNVSQEFVLFLLFSNCQNV